MTSTTDPSLRDAVDVVGFHYSSADDANGNLKKLAQTVRQGDLELRGPVDLLELRRPPEQQRPATSQGGTGTEFGGTNSALEMGNWITTGFAASDRTLNIFQPAIGSFYDGIQYSSKELVQRPRPVVGLDLLRRRPRRPRAVHAVREARLGERGQHRRHLARRSRRPPASQLGTRQPAERRPTGGASYTTLAAPDASDFSTVIVNDSTFTRPTRSPRTD